MALAACSHRTAQVERAMVLPPMAQVHAVESNQRFLMATPIHDPDPAFPVDARLEGELRLCVSFVVDADGEVQDIVADREDMDCADPVDAAATPFVDAVTATLRSWRYFGAAICTFPAGIDPDSDPRCDGAGVAVDAVPIRLRYTFTFSAERGGRVSRKVAHHDVGQMSTISALG
ncbi:energy transducer TonB [Luteimonas fraxinea]|uniref:Energy transducer TonB n=1 Tax=Luteimonas fraxinea TaxID=2901869 RepID=A0ABS8UFF8_9GAMM|nr:energy transducer TonB [Luteimonas fraxinea]MCD9097625.1 energy transducer TonB [Luteimonas fraxinea]UHH08524.1 energy transducer TonB [Luteimonas fraxinea]